MKRIFLISILLAILGCKSADRAKAEAEIAQLKSAISEYYSQNGSLPSLQNADIVKALSGENIKNKIYFEFPSNMLDSKNEVIDPWGTPYSFSSRDGFIYIISFGTNHAMDSATDDDVVGKVAIQTEQGAAANP